MTVFIAPKTVIRIWEDSEAPSAVRAAPNMTCDRSKILDNEAVV
jgi:hypothetical protein